MRNKFVGMRAITFGVLMLTCALVAATTTKADTITVSTTSVAGGTVPPTLTSVTFMGMGATPGAAFQVLCLCPARNLIAEGHVPLNGIVSVSGLEDAAVNQTSFAIRIGDTFYGRFGVSVTNLSLTGQTTPPDCVPEPATLLLLGTGLAGVAIKARKKLRRSKSG